MKPASQSRKIFILLLLLIGPGLVLIFLSKADHKFLLLPYYGEPEISFIAGSDEIDTVQFTVPDFSFINQDSVEVTFADFEDKILVVDFFFTTCPTICPIMTKQMTRLQWILDDSAYEDIRFLSHTVNPKHDTPSVLKAYGTEQGADWNRWSMVTGNQEIIFDQGFNGYLLSTQEDAGAPGGFLHSSMFVLVDKDRHIRGFFDGTSTKEVDDLVMDIKMLMKEGVMRESEKIPS